MFILDTGATFVSLKKAFAQKASVVVDQGSTVRSTPRMALPMGSSDVRRQFSSASLQAKDVPIVVEDDAKATFGDGIDGLLGMSFLSRFKVTNRHASGQNFQPPAE